jgi:hypothetical protein
MPTSFSSALVSDQGTLVSLRLNGHFYQLSQEDLRTVLGLPQGPPGLGVVVDRDRLRFEFVEDAQTTEISASKLRGRLARFAKNRV